ncbi:MAG: glucose 1-dehydrogenase [Chloroflexota bacterium]|nr:glucose 1-dehydrogenase [Chloroflexota bacterium]
MALNRRLEGKVAIVTGASNGMGAAEAKLLASEGARVVACDIQSAPGEKVVSEILAEGGEAEYVHCDVTSEKEWESVVEGTVSRYGALHVLVNNAGISSTSVEDNLSTESWEDIMNINATGVFLGTKTTAEVMKEQGSGSIVNISSIMGFVGGEYGHPAYHASKGAVRIFSKAMAVKYGPYGVRVNTVHPGFMPPMTSSNHPTSGSRARYVEQTPLRRTGEVIEVAYGVLFLASDEASFVTGTELVIDGGYIAQ